MKSFPIVLQIHANCRIRRVFFSDRLYSEEELPAEFKLYLPVQNKAKVSTCSQAWRLSPVLHNYYTLRLRAHTNYTSTLFFYFYFYSSNVVHQNPSSIPPDFQSCDFYLFFFFLFKDNCSIYSQHELRTQARNMNSAFRAMRINDKIIYHLLHVTYVEHTKDTTESSTSFIF